MGNNWIFSDFLLKCIMLFLCEVRQQTTMVVAGSVTLSTSKNRGYLFSYPTEIVIDVSKGLFSPLPVFQNSGTLLDFVFNALTKNHGYF